MKLLSVFLAIVSFCFALRAAGPAEKPQPEKCVVAFTPADEQKSIPERYRLDAHKFESEMTLKKSMPLSGVDIYEVRFPSPVKTSHPVNNTVHAEYYRPTQDGPFPCVLILDITAGDMTISRTMARHLAKCGIGGVCVHMAYYGPRRPNGSRERLLSYDMERTFEATRQTVLDLRRAVAWMESRPEINKKNLGIMGTSLGSFLAALTAEMEPKLNRVAVVLGGGDFIDGYHDHPKAAPYFKLMECLGITQEVMKEAIAPVDPITCAANLKDRKVLIIAAKKDEIVPPKMAENLWNATGRQKLIWLNAGHFTASLYFLSGLNNVVEHFKAD
ncbi:MAG: alpha/beta hydrolase family protein [Planctomycetes bacterium]|nr:alpha/beta hydrolase family protein [Planctomycetota bacterium]